MRQVKPTAHDDFAKEKRMGRLHAYFVTLQ